MSGFLHIFLLLWKILKILYIQSVYIKFTDLLEHLICVFDDTKK